MSTPRASFRALHGSPSGFILPNPWDVGSARILASLGFSALATTSAGHAASLGRLDSRVERDEALDHARLLVSATSLPVNADLENGYADSPEAVAETVRAAAATGLAGCSIEDWDRDREALYGVEAATERIRAAAEAAHSTADPLVLTARAENHLRGNTDLADTIQRLQAFQEAGADVLYAPALREAQDIRSVLASVDLPLNVLLLPGGPPVKELFALGVRRVSLGSWLAHAALAGLVEAANELLGPGTHEFASRAAAAIPTIRRALAPQT